MGLRGDAIAEFDWTVGAVMDKLEQLGIADNTLLIVTSDNGPVLEDGYMDGAREKVGDHDPAGGIRGNKYGVYEAGARVPAIVRWKGRVSPGSESAALVSHVDLLATFAGLVGGRIPRAQAPDSREALAAWLGEDGEGRDYVIEQANNRCLSVRTKEWKYVEPSDGPAEYRWAPGSETGYLDIPQLYHLPDDPREQHNTATDHPEVVRAMQEILLGERSR